MTTTVPHPVEPSADLMPSIAPSLTAARSSARMSARTSGERMPGTGPRTIALMIECDGPGGAEIMLMQTAEELRRRGHRVVPVLPDRGEGWLGEEFRKRGFGHETFSIRRPLDPGCLRGMIRMLREQRIDIVHSHEFTMAVYGAAAARWIGVPHVITWHGSQTAMDALRRRMALRWAFRQSRSVVAVSQSTHADLVERLGVTPSNLTTIPNGIAFHAGVRDPLRRTLGLTPDDVLIVAVGNLVPRKGHHVLLQALAALPPDAAAARWHVAIAGGGEAEGSLREFSAAAGIAERVHLLGHRGDVADILAAADIFTMPSLWEGLPVAMLEAMFAGRPIVASGVSGIPEAITSAEEGSLVPPGDPTLLAAALAPLITDAGRRARMGAAARERAEARFSVRMMVDDYLQAYGIGS